jgi:cyclohexa-1,5-dienecarbonyl-CoA hydratase
MPSESTQNIRLSRLKHTAVITIERPPLNVLNIETMKEINRTIESLKGESGLRLVVITSEGEKAFSAGVDVQDHTKDKVEEMIETFNRLFYLLDDVDAVTIAGVKGAALGGGCELAMACDLILAADNVKMGQPEIKLAVIAPVACAFLPGLVGLSRAKELLLSGETVGADEALKIGLVNRVVPIATFDEELALYSERFASNSAVGIDYTKKAIRIGLEQGYPRSLREIGKMYLKELMSTNDASEGLKSFLEKRRPSYKDI